MLIILVTSIAMMKHHGQGNLQKEALNWVLTYSFQGLVHNHHGLEFGG